MRYTPHAYKVNGETRIAMDEDEDGQWTPHFAAEARIAELEKAILDAYEELGGEAEFSCRQYETVQLTPGWREAWRNRPEVRRAAGFDKP